MRLRTFYSPQNLNIKKKLLVLTNIESKIKKVLKKYSFANLKNTKNKIHCTDNPHVFSEPANNLFETPLKIVDKSMHLLSSHF